MKDEEVSLIPGEFITQIIAGHGGVLDSITIITNTARTFKYGGSGGKESVIKFAGEMAFMNSETYYYNNSSKNINGKILKKIIFQIGLLTHHLSI